MNESNYYNYLNTKKYSVEQMEYLTWFTEFLGDRNYVRKSYYFKISHARHANPDNFALVVNRCITDDLLKKITIIISTYDLRPGIFHGIFLFQRLV